jgi:hypothetical protein
MAADPGPLTTADLNKLDKAIALGVLRVTYSSGTVEYQSIDAMMKARAFVAGQLASSASKPSLSTLAVFHRG